MGKTANSQQASWRNPVLGILRERGLKGYRPEVIDAPFYQAIWYLRKKGYVIEGRGAHGKIKWYLVSEPKAKNAKRGEQNIFTGVPAEKGIKNIVSNMMGTAVFKDMAPVTPKAKKRKTHQTIIMDPVQTVKRDVGVAIAIFMAAISIALQVMGILLKL